MLYLHTTSFKRKMSNNQESVTMSNIEKREKMKKQLEKIGMYQADASLEYMKKILDVVQESMEMANIPINNAENQKDLPYSINNLTNKSDVTVKGNSISETDNSRAKPSCSYNTHSNNSSSESPKPRNKRNIGSKKKMDNNDGSDNGADKNSCQKSKNNSLQESNKVLSLQKDFLNQCKRWKLNPLDSQSNLNDVALQLPKRPPAQERLPFRLCKGTHTEEETVKILNDLNIHLKNMAKLWLSCHGMTELKFQWGTPIQVVDTDNNSLGRISSMVDCYYDDDDIDMISNYGDEENIISNCDDEDNLISNYDRLSKRKASWIANAKLSNSSSDDETTLSFIKKAKSEDTSKLHKTLRKKELLNQEKDYLKDLDKEDLFSNNNLINEKDDSKSINVETLQEPNERMISPEILSNPRRNILSKSSLLDNKNKTQVSSLSLRSRKDSYKSDLEESPSTSRKESPNNMQMKQELVAQLERIDKNINEASVTEDVIKPLPMKNFSARLAKQCAQLKQTEAERKRKILSDQREALRKTLEEKEKKKQDYIKRRKQEMEEMTKEKQKALNKEKRKDRLMEVLESNKSTNRAQKWKDQEKKLIKKQKKNIDIEEEFDELIEEIETDNFITTIKIMCPICHKLFANTRIENHAAMCDQFQTEDEFEQDYIYSAQNSKCTIKDKMKASLESYECNICSSFQTDNDTDYEDHVNECIQCKQNSSPRGTPIIIDVPDSPINSYQSISEQTNSSIDYTDQLTNITKKAQVGRKRRR